MKRIYQKIEKFIIGNHLQITKHILPIIFLLSTSIVCQAQIQNGLVKTNGRPDKPGSPLSNVAVKARDCNVSLSTPDGVFNIAMNGLKGGDSFFLTSVMKVGYELADRNAIGRKYGYSASVPIVLTMVSKAEVEKEKQRIRNNAIVSVQKEYSYKIEELERKLDEQAITEENFSEQLQALQNKMDKYNELIENLADKYARTDYDRINAIDIEINKAIENGLFSKADSLIRSKGNIDQRHKKVLEWNTSSKKQKESIDRQMAQWEDSESLRMQELENLADDYFHSFTIEVSRMHPEEAVSWLEKRLELDPECFEWLIETGRYHKTYLGQNKRAMEFFDRAYRIAQKAELISQYITVLIEQGGVYVNLHNSERAKSCYMKALQYAEGDRDQYYQAIASIYNNLGLLGSIEGNNDEALEYYRKSLSVASDSLLESAVNTYSNMSVVFHRKNMSDSAGVYIEKAIGIATRTNNKRVLSTCLKNKGTFFNKQGKDTEALRYYEKALSLEKEIYPATHPSIATTLCNIATSYYAKSLFKESLANYIQGLSIYQKAYGNKHPDVAYCYDQISSILSDIGQLEKALNYAKKSWEINRYFYPETSKRYADYCNSLGRIYSDLNQDSLAMASYMKAQKIYESIGMSKSSSYAAVCNNISTSLVKNKKYDDAIEYTKIALKLTSDIKGQANHTYIIGLNNLAYIYEKNNMTSDALAIYKEAENLIIQTYGQWHFTLGNNYNNVGCIYLSAKDYDKAREYFHKSLEICNKVYGKQPVNLTMLVLANIGMTYFNDARWNEALPWLEKAASVRLKLNKNKYQRYLYHTYIYKCYSKMAGNGNANDVQNFKHCQDSLWFNISILADGLAAKKYGLNGEYTLLSFANWEQGGELDFTEEANRMKDIAQKCMLLYKDGKIEEIHFEDAVIGINMYISVIDKSTAANIRTAFKNWKSKRIVN